MGSRHAFLLFFSIVIVVYFAANFYIHWHIKQWKPNVNWVGWAIQTMLIIFVLAYPLGRILERFHSSPLTDIIIKMGSFWLGAMLYLVLLFAALDLLRLAFYVARFFTNATSLLQPFMGARVVQVIILIAISLVIYGYFNALSPVVRRVQIATPKYLNPQGRLRLAVASDIHLGTVISNGRLKKLVSLMNGQEADVMLLVGDVFDEDIGPVIRKNMGNLISQFHAPLGVFAVTGNHEFIGGVAPAVDYLTEHGVTVLRDSSCLIGNSVYLIGREDRQAKFMGNYQRKTINELISSLDSAKFMVLMDHQPLNLTEASDNRIDLQLSGHTHHGQLWPLNFITKAAFRISRGFEQIDNTHFYVSSGFGTWGPPMRIGNRPEIVVIDVVTR